MAFKRLPSKLPDIIIVQSDVYPDHRGHFVELSKTSEFKDLGIPHEFPQKNLSYSKKNVIRGLHFQHGEHAQGKMVYLISGNVRDVFVDMRKESATYKQWDYIDLVGGSGVFVYIPAGFAHGFSVLSDEAHFLYACTKEYNKGMEGGIHYKDPTLNINWGVEDPIVSEKDDILPFLD